MRLLFFVFIFSWLGYSQDKPKDIFDVARFGTVEDMKAYVSKDKNAINAINDRKSSVLILACYRGNDAVATYLINQKPNLNYNSENGTALMASVFKNNLNISKLLLENGADANITDGNGTTALMYAVQFKSIEMIKLLLKFKADKTIKNKENKTAFEYAVFSGDEQIINLLK